MLAYRFIHLRSILVLYISLLLFFTLGSSPAQPLQKRANSPSYPPLTWHALSNKGLKYSVHALAVSGSDLYAGGVLTTTGDGTLTKLGHIVRYDMDSGAWHALPNLGLNSQVEALAVSGSDLYVGGSFTNTGDSSLPELGYIARYDTQNGAWYALPNQGLNSDILTMAVSEDNLYVGGYFTATGDNSIKNLGHIARYNTTYKTWHAMPNQGLDNIVITLAVSGSDLFTGGDFTALGDGSLANMGYIARFDFKTNTWHALPQQGLYGPVWALAAYKSDLFVGGHFDSTGDGMLTDLGSIARFDTATSVWYQLPNQGFNEDVISLEVSEDDLYVGGWFQRDW